MNFTGHLTELIQNVANSGKWFFNSISGQAWDHLLIVILAIARNACAAAILV
jgi:hypothetical protein